MESEMIERVARALAVRRAGAEVAAVSEFQAGNLWCEAKADARAAIEAMREPTEAMIGAGAGQPRPPTYTAEHEAWRAEGYGAAAKYRAMIDAALTPVKQPA